MMGHTRTTALVAAALAIAVSSQTPAASQGPASPQIPGITARDLYPNGCVDCHVTGKDGDLRMSVLMEQWANAAAASLVEEAKAASTDPSRIKGKHPRVSNVKADLPRTCLSACHRKGSTIAPPFGRLMHTIHLTGVTGHRYLSAHQGACTHCHKLDQKTGVWKMPSATEK